MAKVTITIEDSDGEVDITMKSVPKFPPMNKAKKYTPSQMSSLVAMKAIQDFLGGVIVSAEVNTK